MSCVSLRMLRFTKHYKVTIQGKFNDFDTSFCYKFTGVGYMCAKYYQNKAWFEKSYCKIKWCSVFGSQCTNGQCVCLIRQMVAAVGFDQHVHERIYTKI